ncbi:MAG: glucuronate isomerase [Caldilineaceae bacterium]|nr:glucuronate isomerase [Caldilineaceae bacterium]
MGQNSASVLASDRYLGPDARRKEIALELLSDVEELPIVAPHGHVDPRLFAQPDYRFASPVDLFIIPDHYILRMLYSQGIALEELGVAPRDGSSVQLPDHRQIWQTFADHLYLFRGTPSGLWLREALVTVLGIDEKLRPENAQAIYDRINARLQEPDFTPRALYARFNIEVLCTTDRAVDPLTEHQTIRESGWPGRILPTFRPDALFDLSHPDWKKEVDDLSRVSGIEVTGYKTFLQAVQERRAFFKQMGGRATDHGAPAPVTYELPVREAKVIFKRALKGEISGDDARRFTGHMLMEMARMSVEDGLVMQLHAGSYRNHNRPLYARFGPDIGGDIPRLTEFTRNLAPLLEKYGNEPSLTLILFTLDETTYARELAPLAGHYPALRLGPPWWFHDSLNGMARYFDQVMETAGLYNTAGFNDDTRAFLSIPVRHNMWRRASVNWLAGLILRQVIDMDDARAMAYDMAYGLVKRTYRL